MSNTDTATRLQSPFPVYSDTDLEGVPPFNKEGTIKLFQFVNNFKIYRNQFLTNQTVLEPNSYLRISKGGFINLTKYIENSLAIDLCLSLFFIGVTTVVLIAVIGSRLRIGYLKTLNKEYECGIDQLLVSTGNFGRLASFRTALLFVIFEIESISLFTVLPNTTILGATGAITELFILLIFQIV
jgi:NADH:ubiquinone oxidoreductase subunit 3 (subunit A)